MTLTPELTSQGWRDIGEIKTCKDCFIQIGMFYGGDKLVPALTYYIDDLEPPYNFDAFRILAPVTTWQPIEKFARVTFYDDDDLFKYPKYIFLAKDGDSIVFHGGQLFDDGDYLLFNHHGDEANINSFDFFMPLPEPPKDNEE